MDQKELKKYKRITEAIDNTEKIIKLNEELTAENAKICQSNDDLSLSNESFRHQLEVTRAKLSWEIECRDTDEKISVNRLRELQKIKSKWWYKLMMWEW